LAVCFFPAGFSALSLVGPPSIRNVAFSLAVPVGFLIGGGAVPAALGMMGEHGSFALGIMLYGVLLFSGLILLRYLRFYEDGK
jgi:NNP family nitrate/nitrite transporter-like MFS transporter